MPTTLTRGALCALAFLITQAGHAGSPPTKLQVRSATVDLEAHQAAIELFNSGDKTVAAYTLRVQEFDAAGKRVIDKVTGFDCRYYPEPGVDKKLQAGETQLIHPGESYTYPAAIQPETVSVQASIVSVVNEDRTTEGDPKDAHLVFIQRKQTAQELRQALQIVKLYPATPEEFTRTLQHLRALTFGTALGVLANQLHLSAGTANVLFDNRRPLPAIALPTKSEWDALTTQLSTEAAYFEAQSQEAAQ